MLRDIFIEPLLLSKSNAAEDSCQVLNVCLTSANKNTNCLNVLEFCVATLACFQGPRLHRGRTACERPRAMFSHKSAHEASKGRIFALQTVHGWRLPARFTAYGAGDVRAV